MLTNIVLSMEPGGPIQIPTGKKTYINHILVELSDEILNEVIFLESFLEFLRNKPKGLKVAKEDQRFIGSTINGLNG